MKPGEHEILATFDKCPNCGSERRLMEELVKEQREQGKIQENTKPCLQMLSSIAAPPQALIAGLVGALHPVGIAITDACMDCGTVYAVQLLRGEAGQPARMPSAGGP